MTCLDMTLPGALSNAGSLPFAEVDPLLNAGSLMLFEPAHPANPYAGDLGPPVVGTGGATRSRTMPNIAARSAKILTAGTDATVSPIFTRNDNLQGDGTAPAGGLTVDGIVERTLKGGIHIIAPQTGEQDFRTRGVIIPNAIRSYMYANPTNLIYFSVWHYITRVTLSATAPYIAIAKQNNAGWFQTGKSGPSPLTLSNQALPVGSRTATGLIHEEFANVMRGGVTSATDVTNYMYGIGLINGAFGTPRNAAMSGVIYRAYMEDLTVSGRTFAQVAAADEALRVAAFAPGGRYNGDTWTAPSAYP